jgi:hypothetical protein
MFGTHLNVPSINHKLHVANCRMFSSVAKLIMSLFGPGTTNRSPRRVAPHWPLMSMSTRVCAIVGKFKLFSPYIACLTFRSDIPRGAVWLATAAVYIVHAVWWKSSRAAVRNDPMKRSRVTSELQDGGWLRLLSLCTITHVKHNKFWLIFCLCPALKLEKHKNSLASFPEITLKGGAVNLIFVRDCN